MRIPALFLSLLFFAGSLGARPAVRIRPPSLTTEPVIDGLLDDVFWTQAAAVSGFKTFMPDYGHDLSEPTTAYAAYDDHNLYFAFRCRDSRPDQIKASVNSRDSIIPDDFVCINLDTFGDQQSLYALYVNPLGIQADSRFAAGQEDFSVDLVWYSAGRIDSAGYSVEIRIPLKSLRYASGDRVTMRIFFERKIGRLSTHGSFPEMNPDQGTSFLTQTALLEFGHLPGSNLVECIPAVTWSRQSLRQTGSLHPVLSRGEFGLTAKWGIASDLTLDGTVNPDFSQVEADAGQIDFNQRYALFYPEKRPFFLEGQEHFRFGGYSSGDPLGAVVHTRNIVNPVTGIKISGKAGAANTLASIYALDELPEDAEANHAHFAILRYKRTLDRDSFAGGFLTSRVQGNHANHVLGTDGQIRINEKSQIGFHAFGSHTGGEKGDVRTGYAAGLNYMYNTRNWLAVVRMHDLSRNFDTEAGYLNRTDISRVRVGVIRYIYPGSGLILRLDPLLNNQFIHDKASGLWESSNELVLTALLPRSTQIRAGVIRADEIFLGQSFSRNRVNLIAVSQITNKLSFSLSWTAGKMIRYSDPPFQGRGHTAASDVTFQPSANFQSALSLSYTDLVRDDTGEPVFDYTIVRFFNTYQVNRYLFFRAVLEYNTYYEQLTTDFLASFTYIPGTVLHAGYGSQYSREARVPDQGRFQSSDRFLEMRRGLFVKASYLWRL